MKASIRVIRESRGSLPASCKGPGPVTYRAFTPIELLVAIASIALLDVCEDGITDPSVQERATRKIK